MNRHDKRVTDALAEATRLAVEGATLDQAAQRLSFMNGESLRVFLLDQRYVGTARALATNPGLPVALTEFDRIIIEPRDEDRHDKRRPRHAKPS